MLKNVYLRNDSFDNIDNAIKREYEKIKNVYPYYLVEFLCTQDKYCTALFYLFKEKPDITFYYFYSNNLYRFNLYNHSNTSLTYSKISYTFGHGFSTLSSQINFNNLTVENTAPESNIYQHFSGNTYIYKNNNIYSDLYPIFIYDANFDIKKGASETNTNFDFKIGDKYYQENDVLPTYKDTLKPKTPNIDVSFENLETTMINGIEYVSKKRINMKFNNYDITKHQVYIAHDVPKAFYEITPNFFNQKYYLDTDRNTTIYLKILDRETQENLYSTSINIRNILIPIPSLKLTLEEIEYLNNDTSLPPLHYLYKAKFDYFNLDNYIYKYYYPDYDTVINITENDHLINVGVNGNLIFSVYDKKTNELVYTYTQNISGLFGTYFPQISIKHHEFEYLNCGEEKRVYSESLNIYFSILDSDKYIYEYSMNDIDYVKYDIKNYVSGYYFRYIVYSNSTLYVRVKNKSNNEILSTNSYVINTITYDSNDVMCILGDNYNDNLKALQKYLAELKLTSNDFNDLFHSFYDNLPSFIQLGLVFAYIVLLIFITLILGGWK